MTTNQDSEARAKARADDGRRHNGGARPGAGGVKPALSADEPTVRATITLPASLLERLRELGNGNVSRGVRILLDQ